MAQPQISSSSAPVRLLGCTNASELATGELEDKLRLLDLHRHTAMERCNQFLSEMEAAMQRAEEHREASSIGKLRFWTPSHSIEFLTARSERADALRLAIVAR